jgi:hypothetical protein
MTIIPTAIMSSVSLSPHLSFPVIICLKVLGEKYFSTIVPIKKLPPNQSIQKTIELKTPNINVIILNHPFSYTYRTLPQIFKIILLMPLTM